MNIRLSAVGKRFNTEWVFRNFSYDIKEGGRYAITGPNGSGKSTLLQVIGGYIRHNSGLIVYEHDQKVVAPETIFSLVSMAAPYLEVIEEMTLKEFLVFHRKMKGLHPEISDTEIADAISLKSSMNKQIRYFSSGMKQRVKLAQAIFGISPLVLLDEPLTNLDAEGVSNYNYLIDTFTKCKTLLVSSNDEREYKFCDEKINLKDYKENYNS